MPSFTPPFPSHGDWMSAPAGGGRVAIITRTRNRNLLLGRALESVLGQSHADWHLYLVNDGGDAEAVEATLAPHRAGFGERLTVIHNPLSLGMEAASNRALVVAQAQAHIAGAAAADFLVVHDDDDAWHADFLEETVGFLLREENARFAAVLTRMICVHERLEADRVVELARAPWPEWQPTFDGAQLLSRNLFSPIAFLIRMAVVRQIGPYNDQLPVIGDWDYNMRIFAVGDIGTIDRPLAYYHLRPDATGAYGNSVEAGRAQHQRYNVHYRNALLRAHLNADPGAAGALMTQLHLNADTRHTVLCKLDALAAAAPVQAERLAELADEIAGAQAALAGRLAALAAAGPVQAQFDAIAAGQMALAARLEALAEMQARQAALAEAEIGRQMAAQAEASRRLDAIETRLAGMGLRGWWRKRWRRLRGGGARP